jgi:ComF family protein
MRLIKTELTFKIISEVLIYAEDRIKQICREIDYLIPVPADQRRLKVRGFNQSYLIAKYLSNVTSKPVYKALNKTQTTPHQAGKSKVQRKLQSKEIYKLKNDKSKLLKNKSILLIDDVATTCTTLSNCAQILQKSSPKSLKGFVIFRGKKLGNKNSEKDRPTASKLS